MAKNIVGQSGEALVAQSLQKEKFTILATNYRARFGEIDIIAQKDDVVAFVEVKTRKHQFGDIGDLVNLSKQKKIIKTAFHYIAIHQPKQKTYRFDVAFVHFQEANPEITYIHNAFSSESL